MQSIDRTNGVGSRVFIGLILLVIVGGGNFGAMDTDNDGLQNYQEFSWGTDFQSADTVGDGLEDGVAVELGLDPAVPHPDVTE